MARLMHDSPHVWSVTSDLQHTIYGKQIIVAQSK